jgi:hypothetical protein
MSSGGEAETHPGDARRRADAALRGEERLREQRGPQWVGHGRLCYIPAGEVQTNRAEEEACEQQASREEQSARSVAALGGGEAVAKGGDRERRSSDHEQDGGALVTHAHAGTT